MEKVGRLKTKKLEKTTSSMKQPPPPKKKKEEKEEKEKNTTKKKAMAIQELKKKKKMVIQHSKSFAEGVGRARMTRIERKVRLPEGEAGECRSEPSESEQSCVWSC